MGNKSPTFPTALTRCSLLSGSRVLGWIIAYGWSRGESSAPGGRAAISAFFSNCWQRLPPSEPSELSGQPRQRRGEGLVEFHGRLENQYPSGPELNSAERERKILLYFVEGIADPLVRAFTLEWGPSDSLTALIVAQGRFAQLLSGGGYNLLPPAGYRALSDEELRDLLTTRAPDLRRFRQLRQRVGETVLAYHERFHMLLTRAYPMLDSMKDFSFVPEFLEGLEDPRIRIQIEEFVNQEAMVTYPLLVHKIIQIGSTSKAEGEGVENAARMDRFNQAQQGPTELINEYHERIQGLYRQLQASSPRTYPVLTDHGPPLLTHCFIRGLADADIRHYVKEQRPSSRDLALKLAQERQIQMEYEACNQEKTESVLSYHGRFVTAFERTPAPRTLNSPGVVKRFVRGLVDPQVRMISRTLYSDDYGLTLWAAHSHETALSIARLPRSLFYFDPDLLPDAVRTVSPGQLDQLPTEDVLEYHRRLPLGLIQSVQLRLINEETVSRRFVAGLNNPELKTILTKDRPKSYFLLWVVAQKYLKTLESKTANSLTTVSSGTIPKEEPSKNPGESL
ncbi:unnamed protein product [Sphagnum tenellum]